MNLSKYLKKQTNNASYPEVRPKKYKELAIKLRLLGAIYHERGDDRFCWATTKIHVLGGPSHKHWIMWSGEGTIYFDPGAYKKLIAAPRT